MNSIGSSISVIPGSQLIANPIARQATGLAGTDTKQDIFKAVEEPSKTSPGNANTDSKTANLNTPARPDQDSAERTAEELAIIRELAARDREVRAHEQAHASVGGQYAGAPSYTYQRGPNGVNYAVGGEVSISVPSGGNAQSRLRAAEQIQRAALAPANPSAQDRQVAAQAAQTATQARADIAAENAQAREAVNEAETETESGADTDSPVGTQTNTVSNPANEQNNSAINAFETIANASDPGSLFNQIA